MLTQQFAARSCHLRHQQPRTASTLTPSPAQTAAVPSRHRKRQANVRAFLNELFCVAGASPDAMQDLIVGGVVFGTIGFALVAGLKKEQVICDLCQGNGGSRCFGCLGEGKMTDLISRDALLESQAKRDVLGRSASARSCRVCKGAGLIACSKCRGSGYMNG